MTSFHSRRLERAGQFFDRVTDFLGNHQGFSRAWGLVLLGGFIALCTYYLHFLGIPDGSSAEIGAQKVARYVATLLALLPSMVALGHFAAKRRRSVSLHTEALIAYLEFRKKLASEHCKRHTGCEPSPREPGQSELTHHKKDFDHLLRPRGGQFLLGAAMLALPFLIVASLSDVIHGVVEPPSQKYLLIPFGEGLRGLVFTGYGIFVYTLVVLIHRMHAGALSAEFLMSAALRVTTMLLIGFMVGEMNLFSQQRGASQLPSIQAAPLEQTSRW